MHLPATGTFFLYKIRNTKNGLFSTGGKSPRWVKKGKTWHSIGSLKLHLDQFTKFDEESKTASINIPANWEVIKYQVQPAEIGQENAIEFFKRHGDTFFDELVWNDYRLIAGSIFDDEVD